MGLTVQDMVRMSDAAVSIRGLYKVFNDDGAGLELALEGGGKDAIQESTGAVVGLSNINLEVGRGQVFVVMGLSGCGKSTLVRCINRLIEPSAGEVWIDGQNVTAMDEETLRELRRHQVAMVFQHFGLMPHRTVMDNVAMPLEVGGVGRRERRERAAAALELVGLSDWGQSMPRQLSGGMKQRVGLARGLALETPLLLMDEPFSALDPVIRRDLQDELMTLQETVQKTIIFITHDLSEAVRVGDRIAIMRDGRVVQQGTPNEVVLEPANAFVREFTQDVRLHAMVTAASVMEPPSSLSGSQLISAAAAELEQTGDTHCRVVDGQGRYLGTAELGSLLAEARRDDRPLQDAALYIANAVWVDTVLDDLVPTGLRSQYPLPVLDEDGVLVGQIPLDQLARVMASDVAEVGET